MFAKWHKNITSVTKFWVFLFLVTTQFYYLHAQEAIGNDSEWDTAADSSAKAAVEKLPPVPKNDIRILVNGELFKLKPELELSVGRKLEIQIDGLYPKSELTVKIEKAGTTFVTQTVKANAEGNIVVHLDTGNTRIAGDATLTYITAAGQTKKFSAKVRLI